MVPVTTLLGFQRNQNAALLRLAFNGFPPQLSSRSCPPVSSAAGHTLSLSLFLEGRKLQCSKEREGSQQVEAKQLFKISLSYCFQCLCSPLYDQLCKPGDRRPWQWKLFSRCIDSSGTKLSLLHRKGGRHAWDNLNIILSRSIAEWWLCARQDLKNTSCDTFPLYFSGPRALSDCNSQQFYNFYMLVYLTLDILHSLPKYKIVKRKMQNSKLQNKGIYFHLFPKTIDLVH